MSRRLAPQKFFKTMRFLQDDWAIVKTVKHSPKLKDSLIDSMNRLKFDNKQTWKSSRFGVSLEVDTKIREIVNRTGLVYVDVFLAACKDVCENASKDVNSDD